MFSLYGNNWWGAESSKGYARIHVPLGGKRTTIRAPILIAKCSNIWSAISSWFTDRNPELRDPKILLEGTKTKGFVCLISNLLNHYQLHFCLFYFFFFFIIAEGLYMESYGELVVTLQTITKGGETLCLDWN